MNKVFVLCSLVMIMLYGCLNNKVSKAYVENVIVKDTITEKLPIYHLLNNYELMVIGQFGRISDTGVGGNNVSCADCSQEEKQRYINGPIVDFGRPITGMKTRRIYYLRGDLLISGKDTFNRWDSLFWQIQ